MKNGRFLNNVLATGIFVSNLFNINTIFTDEIYGKELNKTSTQKNIQQNKKIINLSKEEATLAEFFYSFINNASKKQQEKSDDVKISEAVYIAKLYATVGNSCNKTAYELISQEILKNNENNENNENILKAKSFDLSKIDNFFIKCINLAKDLISNQKNYIWNSENSEDTDVPCICSLKSEPLNNINYIIIDESRYFIFYKKNTKNLPSTKFDSSICSDIDIDIKTMTKDELFLAQVLYSETYEKCSENELKLICNVILNRIGKKDLGNAKNAAEVAKVPGAFTAVKKNNIPFIEFSKEENKNNPYVIRAKKYAKALMTNQTNLLKLEKNDTIVYFHDKRVTLPDGFINKWYIPVEVKRTKHFVFYKIVPNTKNLKAEKYKKDLRKDGKLYFTIKKTNKKK